MSPLSRNRRHRGRGRSRLGSGTGCRFLLAALVVASLAAPPASFADTVTGVANGNNPKVFTFVADSGGQVLVTLTWKKRPRDLLIVVVDTEDDPLTWCAAIARQDRVQRCEFGAVSGQQYAIGVQTLRGRSRFQLNVQSSDSELVLAPGADAGLRELQESDPGAAAIRRAVERAVDRAVQRVVP